MTETSAKEPITWLTRSGVAQLLQVSPNTVTRWAHEGRLPYQLTLGGHHRFDRRVVEDLRHSLRIEGDDEGNGSKPKRR